MRGRGRICLTSFLCAAALGVFATAADAAPPANDARTAPQRLASLPARGTAATLAFRAADHVEALRVVTGDYDGTRTTSPSNGGTATFRVVEPLT